MKKKNENLPGVVSITKAVIPDQTPPATTKPETKPRPMANQVPINMPGGNMQMTPIIQPIAFVPYTTQSQPIYSYDDEYDDVGDYTEPAETVAEAEVVPVVEKKRVSIVAIILSILALAAVAVFVIGKFVAGMTFLHMVNETSGLDLAMTLFSAFELNTLAIITLGIIVAVVCAVLVLISSLIRIFTKGACVGAKIFVFIGLIGALLAVFMALVNKDTVVVGIGLYILAGICLLMLLIAFLAPNKKKA